jgi:hypothetical protein
MSDIANQINAAHQEVLKAFGKSTLDAAIKAGELLNIANENVKAEKGKWSDWLTENGVDIPKRTIRVYRQLAENKDRFKNWQRAATSMGDDLSVRGALKLIPKNPKRVQAMAERKAAKAAEKAAVEPPAKPKSRTIEDNLLNMDVDDLFTALRDNWDNDQLAKLTLKLGDHLKSLGVPPPPIRRRENETGAGAAA